MLVTGLVREKELDEALRSAFPEHEELLRDELMSIQLGVVARAAEEDLSQGDSSKATKLFEVVGGLATSRREVHPELESAIMSDLLEPFETLDDGIPTAIEGAMTGWLQELLEQYRRGGPW